MTTVTATTRLKVAPLSHKKVKKWRKQKFNQDWLLLNQFKGWLKPVEADEYSCQSTACICVLTCGKSELQKHSKGLKHLKKSETDFKKCNYAFIF